jgi:hypothetical protein
VEKPNQSSETLSHRVRRTLEDLALIRQSLQRTNSQPNGANGERNPVLDLELAAELKIVVDTLRELLWAYIAALSTKSGRRPQEVLEWYKMELAVEMLRNKNARAAISEGAEAVGTSTFEDLVTTALTVTAMHTGQERRV